MLRWLVIGVVGYAIYMLVRNELRARANRKDAPGTNASGASGSVEGGDMVKDPICGAYVAVASSVSVRDGETVHRFCSYECRDAYLERLRDAGREIPQHRKSEDE